MDISHLIETLNEAQREAVTAPLEHILVLAGAGSGKTKVLTHRIAWLLEKGHAQPHNILALTFTNKASNEMRSRIAGLLKTSTPGLWAGTFHGITHRLLRMHWQEALLPRTFQILDSDDQRRILKRLLKSLKFNDDNLTPKEIQHFINTKKDEGIRAKDIVVEQEDIWLTLYHAYEEICQRSGVIAFGELLLRAYEVLRDNPSVLKYHQQRFQYIHVDEYQDTNTIQYKWLRLLAGSHGKLFVVGDDDQSIYGFRGAKIENIQNFQKEFADTQLIRLEQNYRSTGTILAAANALIANNKVRLGKNLWTQDKKGVPIFVYTAYKEYEEAQFVVKKIKAWQGKLKEVAILYRTTAQSREFEAALLNKKLPYRIYGGLRFYQRLEIKDVIAYLCLLLHRDNDGAFERIINTPKRGIGKRTVDILRDITREQKVSLWQATQIVIKNKELKARANNSLMAFIRLIEELSKTVKDLPLHKQVEKTISLCGFMTHYQKDTKEDAQRRLENLDELVNAARQFEGSYKDNSNILGDFLAHATLESGEGQATYDDCVQLMTLHAAKGLEFELVFLCGLEEGLFPHQNCLKSIEEERRLCYVGITRARKQLYLSHSESRYHYGNREFCIPSRFLREIPIEFQKYV